MKEECVNLGVRRGDRGVVGGVIEELGWCKYSTHIWRSLYRIKTLKLSYNVLFMFFQTVAHVPEN